MMSTNNQRAAILPAALWFGLVTGLGEVSLRLLRRHVIGWFNQIAQDAVWTTVVVDVTILLALGIILSGLARLSSRVTLRVAVSLFASVGALAWLLLYQPLHIGAKLLLAAGLGVQVGRICALRFGGFRRLMLMSVGWPGMLLRNVRGRSHDATSAGRDTGDVAVGVGLVVALLVATVELPPVIRERSLAGRTAPAGSPNVLFLMLDTVTARRLSLYGYERRTTPELERIARQGALFKQAFSHSPWTLPSVGSMFTGRYPEELSGTFQKALDDTHTTLSEVLGSVGYRTGGFAANTTYCSYESGVQRGFAHYEDFPLTLDLALNAATLTKFVLHRWIGGKPSVERPGRRSAAALNDRFLRWLDKDPGKPFFAFVNYFDAHAPYFPPAPYDAMFGPAVERPNPRHEFGWTWTEDQIIAERNAYDGALAYLDSQIAILFSTLQARGVMDNTLVVIVGDHGELFGEHELIDHANSLYAPLLHVPLMMIWPGRIPAGSVVERAIGLRHVPATILDLVELDGRLPGTSLTPTWRAAGGSASDEPVLSTLEAGIRVEPWWKNARGGLQSIILGRHHYIRNHDNSEELFDLEADPAELVNLAGRVPMEPYREALARLRPVPGR